MASRQLIILNTSGDPLGTKAGVLKTLAEYNTAPDGSAEAQGVAFGPGFHIELPWVDDGDDLLQAAITVADEEAAWQVLSRLLKETGWALMDIESGQVFGEQAS